MPAGITSRRLRIAVLLGFLGTLSFIAIAAAATAQSHVSVYFLRGEQLASVQRPGRTPLDAMRQLIAGPTPVEVRQGFRTYLPPNTRVFSVKVAHGVVTVDLNERFASGSDRESLLARLSQTLSSRMTPERVLGVTRFARPAR
jgi:hypothetical protein